MNEIKFIIRSVENYIRDYEKYHMDYNDDTTIKNQEWFFNSIIEEQIKNRIDILNVLKNSIKKNNLK